MISTMDIHSHYFSHLTRIFDITMASIKADTATAAYTLLPPRLQSTIMDLPVRTKADIYTYYREICKLIPPNAIPVGPLGVGGGNKGLTIVEHMQTRKLYVLKKFLSHDPVAAIHEVQILRQLSYLPHTSSGIMPLQDYYLEFYKDRCGLNAVSGGIVTEFCRYGTLGHIIHKYRRTTEYIPEAFVWHVFISLARALESIEHGHDHPNWNRVLHQDLWPANVFLYGQCSGSYPFVVLGDFGSGVTEGDIRRNDVPTPRQQIDFLPMGPGDTGVLDPRNDLCQVGLCIVALCQVSMQPRGHVESWEKGHWPTPIGSTYTSELSDIVVACLHHDLTQRPTSRELLDRLTRTYAKMRVERRTLHLMESYVDASGTLRRRDVAVGT